MGKKKREYRVKTGCPQCGCSNLTTMTEEEIRKKYPDLPNATMECGECVATFKVDFDEACPEWDDECKGKDL